MKANHKLLAVAALSVGLALGATFEDIKFDTPILSTDDPLGVNTIVQMGNTIADTIGKGQLTNDVVFIGNANGDSAAMQATTTSIVFAVDRSMEDLNPSNGEILFSSDKLRFDLELSSIWFGNSTLESLLGNSTNGEVNVIAIIKTNNVPLEVVDKTVNIDIPKVIVPTKVSELENDKGYATQSITNGLLRVESDPVFEAWTNTIAKVATSGSYADLTEKPTKVGEFENDAGYVTDAVTNGLATKASVDAKADKTDVYTKTEADKKLNDTLDSYKNPALSDAAQAAINGIDNAQDIATIKETLKTFLQKFVIQSPSP